MSLPDTSAKAGNLYIVATPIGNLEDITFRAVRILSDVEVIAAEDTRHTRKLLTHYGISTRMVSCHEHNETARIESLLGTLQSGQDVALVSDAGTPSVSDPGFHLVRAAIAEGLNVLPIPGPSAVTAGLCVSGLPTDRFVFAGFLSRKKGRRRQELEQIATIQATLVFYESPRRLKSFLAEILEVLGDREAMVGREMTKRYEEYLRGRLSNILENLENRSQVKGECAVFVRGMDTASSRPESAARAAVPGEVAGPGTDPDFVATPEDDIPNNAGVCQAPAAESESGLTAAMDTMIRSALEAGKERPSRIAKELSRQLGLSRQTVYERILVLTQKR